MHLLEMEEKQGGWCKLWLSYDDVYLTPTLLLPNLPTNLRLYVRIWLYIRLFNSPVASNQYLELTDSAVEMSSSQTITQLEVDSYLFPAEVKPPSSTKSLFLGGAGARGLEIDGKFIKFTAIGVYLEHNAVYALAVKWKGKTAEELTDSVEFFNDIITGPFEKFIQVTTILPLTGQQYSEKVAENCVAHWKAIGTYTDAESKAIEKFLEVFKNENFPPGSSILFTQLPLGSLTISFSKGDSLPESWNAVIENKQLSEAVLQSIIGKHGVSPEAKQNLAARLSELFKQWESCSTRELDPEKATIPN